MEYRIKKRTDFYTSKLETMFNSLPKSQKEKISRYKQEKRKQVSIIGAILLKELLKNRQIKYENIEIYQNEYGKPYLKNHALYYNISHSFDYVITIISEKEIGIDIEKIRKTPKNTPRYFATPKEQEYIFSSKEKIEERIFQIYTLKEAYFKMQGTNLNHLLDVEFQIKGKEICCSDSSIQCGFIHDIKGYMIAYCQKK